jgi:hypothetical protein
LFSETLSRSKRSGRRFPASSYWAWAMAAKGPSRASMRRDALYLPRDGLQCGLVVHLSAPVVIVTGNCADASGGSYSSP